MFISLLVLLLAQLAAGDVKGKLCGTMSFFTANSTYQANIEFLAATLPRKAASSWALFATASTGSIPNAIHGLALCRGDTNASTCYTCLKTAFEDAEQICNYDKDATVYYDHCELRYSNQDFLLNSETTDGFGKLIMNNSATADEDNDSMSSSVFEANVNVLMTAISNHAVNSSTRFATGVMQLAGGKQSQPEQLFGLAQCTPDMTPTNCQACLIHIIDLGIHKYNESKSVSAHALRCSFKYGPSSFFSGSPLVRVPMLSPAPTSTHRNKHTVRTTLIVVVAFVVALLLFIVVFLFLRKRNREAYKNLELANTNRQREEESMRSSESVLYDLETLRAATKNFSMENKLGEGGFGPVYKGMLQDGQEIAVKRLSVTSLQGKQEMMNEVFLLAKLHHRNLVRLLGCCIMDHEKLLVYEFLPNNCLAKILFDPARQRELTWGLRKRIIMGICRGLLYLHQDSRLTTIHRDLKSSNILLDANMNPKISDFGLAKLLNTDSSVGNTSQVAGTIGYMAPEYAKWGIFSTKSDVYSFGVLLLEIITGRSNACTPSLSSSSANSEDLLTYVWRHWRCGNVGLLDSCPPEGRRSQEIHRYIKIGLLCIQDNVDRRPNMSSIILMLDSNSTTLDAPIESAYKMVQDRIVTTSANPSQGMTRLPSINEDSISELEPR